MCECSSSQSPVLKAGRPGREGFGCLESLNANKKVKVQATLFQGQETERFPICQETDHLWDWPFDLTWWGREGDHGNFKLETERFLAGWVGGWVGGGGGEGRGGEGRPMLWLQTSLRGSWPAGLPE